MKRMIIGIITCVLCFNSLFTVAKTVMAEEKITMTPIIRENNNGIEYDGEQEEAATAIDTETVFQTQQYMSYYFKNLTDNFGWNVKGLADMWLWECYCPIVIRIGLIIL